MNDSAEKKNMLFDFLLFLLRKRRLVVVNIVLTGLCAVGFTFFVMKKVYRSSVTFLPPASSQPLPAIMQGLDLWLGNNVVVTPEQIITIYTGKAFRRQMIEMFDLYERYRLNRGRNRFERALLKMQDRLWFETEDIGVIGYSNIVSLTIYCLDNDPDTSCLMVKYAYEILDSAAQSIGMEYGRRDREFSEKRLADSKLLLDSLQTELIRFQQENKVVDIPIQMRMTLENVSILRSDIIKNELLLDAQLLHHSPEYPDVKRTKNQIRLLNKKLAELETERAPDVLVGLMRSAELAAGYFNMLRDVEVQTQTILFLSQQVERAKMEETKSVSKLTVIDPPFVPEYKFKPKRLLIVSLIVVLETMFLFVLLFYRFYYSTILKNDHRFAGLMKALRS